MDTTRAQPVAAGRRRHRRGALPALAALALAGCLGGCALPPALALAGYLSDGALQVATGKDTTDTGLSLATGKDCATSRVLWQEDICRDKVEARPEPLPPQLADDAAAASRRVEAMPADDADRAALAERTLAAAFQPMAGTAAVLPQPASAATVTVALSSKPEARQARHPSQPNRVHLARRHRPVHHASPADHRGHLATVVDAQPGAPADLQPTLAVAGDDLPRAFLP